MSLSRRHLLAASTAAMTAKSYAAIPGANDRLKIGVIGCGGMATGHMRQLVRMRDAENFEFAAVCDLFDKRTEASAQLTGAPNQYRDYRKLLENKEVDYVLIATPEHWHAQCTMDAADAGKHIYCEKPMTYNVEDAKRVVAKIKHTGVKMQVGVQGTSDDSYVTANKYIREGALGKVVLAQIDYSRNSIQDDFLWTKPDPDVKPGVNFDWDTWQGNTKKRPFDPDRYFHWRRFWDYSSGIASDLFIHRVTRIIKSLGLTFPSRAVATGGKFGWPNTMGDVPDTMNILLDYPEGMTVQLVSAMGNDTRIQHMIRGRKGTLFFDNEGFFIQPQRPFEDETKMIVHKKSGAEDVGLHHKNLQAAIRKNEPLNCDCTLGYYGVVAAAMGVESLRKLRYVAWDKTKERMVRA